MAARRDIEVGLVNKGADQVSVEQPSGPDGETVVHRYVFEDSNWQAPVEAGRGSRATSPCVSYTAAGCRGREMRTLNSCCDDTCISSRCMATAVS
jgi:hypothetical protein